MDLLDWLSRCIFISASYRVVENNYFLHLPWQAFSQHGFDFAVVSIADCGVIDEEFFGCGGSVDCETAVLGGEVGFLAAEGGYGEGVVF